MKNKSSSMAAVDAARWVASLKKYDKIVMENRLLESEIARKVENISNYHEAFNKAFQAEMVAIETAVDQTKSHKKLIAVVVVVGVVLYVQKNKKKGKK